MSIEIVESAVEDSKLMIGIYQQEGVLKYFPMVDIREIEDAVRVWEIFCKKGASLTAIIDGVRCGIAYLNIQPYKKFEHNCLITIIVDENFRNRGVGTALLKELFKLAKDKFSLEVLHLEVYETNPAIRLYERLGFTKFGFQKYFIKDNGGYIGKTLMECRL